MGTWATLLAQLVGPAIVVAWSPVKIIPALALILGSVNAKTNGLAFLAGSLAGLASITVLFVSIPHAFDSVDLTVRHVGAWGPIAVAAGSVLVLLAVYQWVTRGQPRKPRRWLSSIARITPWSALLLGSILTVANPKVLAMTAVAGVTIGSAAVGIIGASTAVIGYTLVAGSTVLVPVVGYALAADRVDRWLDSWRRWILRHQAGTTAIVLALMGTVLIVFGLRAW